MQIVYSRPENVSPFKLYKLVFVYQNGFKVEKFFADGTTAEKFYVFLYRQCPSVFEAFINLLNADGEVISLVKAFDRETDALNIMNLDLDQLTDQRGV